MRKFNGHILYRNFPSLRYNAHCTYMERNLMKYQRYIYNPKWFKFGANRYTYKIYESKSFNETRISIANRDFAVMTTIAEIKRWFSWERETEIDILQTKHLYQYAFHYELWAKYSD